MLDDPMSNSSVTPPQRVPEYGPENPRLGAGEEAEQRPFSLPPEPGKGATSEAPRPGEKPSPMDIAREGARAQSQLPPEELSGQVERLKAKLDDVEAKLQDPNISSKFTPDHFEAMNRVIERMNPEMFGIAKNSDGKFVPPKAVKGEPVLSYVARWIDGSQETLSNALNYLAKTGKNPKDINMGEYLQLQYSVQRAVQRGELFASVVGASVSGIKTILSTQLG